VDTGQNVGITDLFAYSININPLTLVPGTPFWLSIVNDTAAQTDYQAAWGADLLGASKGRSSPTGPWNFNLTGSTDFQLTATDLEPVPEPATILLLGTTAAGLGLARWRQRRRDKQQA